MLVVIPCGAKKRPEPAPAKELYLGGQFRLALRAAEAIQAREGGRILILSGLHGFVGLDQVLAPYEQRIGKPGGVTRATLQGQAEALGITGEQEVVVLAGKDYADPVRAIWPQAKTPLLGIGGIGYQRQALSRIAKGSLVEGGRS